MLVLLDGLAEGWRQADPFERLEQLAATPVRDVAGRRTFRFEIDGQGYFAKTHGALRTAEILRNLLSLRWPVSGAINEWRAAIRLRGNGVAAIEPVGYGEAGRGGERRSFLVTREITDATSLETCIEAWLAGAVVTAPDGCELPRPRGRRRLLLIDAVAELAARMHALGVNHRDFYICHLWLRAGTDPVPSLRLLDLHRAQMRAVVPERWRRRDLAALLFSVRDYGLGPRALVRFRRTYARVCDTLTRPQSAPAAVWHDPGFWIRVERRARLLQRRELRRGPRPGSRGADASTPVTAARRRA